ncbi:hypothetical protein HanRHA438_Chr05g0224931 [Helianthus annuus]|nr:hypothetical protein HanRHA438_Chr05g0224931 [Helianthus annuus]
MNLRLILFSVSNLSITPLTIASALAKHSLITTMFFLFLFIIISITLITSSSWTLAKDLGLMFSFD